ncbi:MAG: hypothetical protein WA655_05595 [Candidatus Korobacteraceae bacterium]
MDRRKSAKPRKIIDETVEVKCALGLGVIREEVWRSAGGEIVRYNLAFINHSLFAKDNGRVLGYDNKHGCHHRPYAGRAEEFTFSSYEGLTARFLNEVRRLRERTDPL